METHVWRASGNLDKQTKFVTHRQGLAFGKGAPGVDTGEWDRIKDSQIDVSRFLQLKGKPVKTHWKKCKTQNIPFGPLKYVPFQNKVKVLSKFFFKIII